MNSLDLTIFVKKKDFFHLQFPYDTINSFMLPGKILLYRMKSITNISFKSILYRSMSSLSSQWFMPGEWHQHTRCWMLWPYRSDNWRNNAIPAQSAFLEVAKAISKFEPVVMGVPKSEMNKAQTLLLDANKEKFDITLTEIESDDSWMRDVGPSFVLDGQNGIAGVDWKFNAWGEIYKPYDRDQLVASNVINYSKFERIEADFVLEGGSIHVDGEGTVLTTEECLLHPNRNPHLTKEEIESRLLKYLGAKKVIWLPYGLVADEDTNGHIDNMCCFTKPGQVVLCWSEDDEEQKIRSQKALEVFQSTPDAQGRIIDVVKMPIPPTMNYSSEEVIIDENTDLYQRQIGQRMAGSYVNFYIANGGILCPSFGFDTDAQAVTILQKLFPDREIVSVPGREILLGGGNIHCITQQEPKAI